jgi:hypothetical protein
MGRSYAFAWAAALAAFASACHAPAPAPRAPDPAPSTVSTPLAPPGGSATAVAAQPVVSPFFVAASGWIGGPELGTSLTLCPVPGALFACGGHVPVMLRDGSFVADPLLETGLRDDGFVERIAGRWPDSAWLVTAFPDVGNWSYHLYRWRSSGWEHALDVPPGHAGLSFQVVAWRGGVFGRIDSGERGAPAKLVRLDGGAPPTFLPPHAKSKDCLREWIESPMLLTNGDGDLFAYGSPCDESDGTIVERWTSDPKKPEVLRVPSRPPAPGKPPLSGCWAFRIIALDHGVAALGRCGGWGEDSRPYLTTFDGHAWTEVVVPEVRGEAVGYARDESAEWLVAAQWGDWILDGQLLRRATGGEWQAVALPPPPEPDAPEGVKLPSGRFDRSRVFPIDVKTVDGDTWVVGYTGRADRREGSDGVLLRMRPVGSVFSYQH